MKNCKTFYEAQNAISLQEIIQPSPKPPSSEKMFLRLWEKIFLQTYTESTNICFQSISKMQFLRVKKWCSANVFSDTKHKQVCWKLLKVRKVFGCIARAYYFQCQVSRGS